MIAFIAKHRGVGKSPLVPVNPASSGRCHGLLPRASPLWCIVDRWEDSFESVYQRGAKTVHEVMGGEPDGSFLLSSELRPDPTGIHFGAAVSRRTAGPEQKSVCLLAWAAQSLADL